MVELNNEKTLDIFKNAFNKEDKDINCLNEFSINVLRNHLDPSKFKDPIFPEKYKVKFDVGIFVTWLDESSKDYRRRLRGCIGCFHPNEIEKQIRTYTIVSSREDKRFKSVELNELSNFSMSVSIVLPFEETKDIFDWELGKHGVYVSFKAKGKSYGACYLPEVPIIDGWDKKLTLDRCVKKSGYAKELGHLDEVKDSMVVLRFRTIKNSVNCRDYLK